MTSTTLPEHIHLVGVAGAGLSGAARILAERGHRLTGFDRAPSDFAAELAALGVDVRVGDATRAPLGREVELVVRSAAVPLTDADCRAAAARGIPVLKYAELLGRLTPARRTLAVAGTHGKTSASWMLAHALFGLERALGSGAPRTGFLVGGLDGATRRNARSEAPGGWFAVEACEYDRSFLHLRPEGALVTNLEADHLDYYGTLDAIEEAFARFADRVHPDGLLVLGDDVPARVESACAARTWRLGRELQLELLGETRGCFRLRLVGPGWATPPVQLAVPGRFQADNAALALALAVGLVAPAWQLAPDVAAAAAAEGLAGFRGAVRRFERWGQAGGVEVIHDYAHHPTEVRVTLEAARRALPGMPLHVLFQPHQHSRTARFLPEFVESLRGVDRVVVADVYGARAHIDAHFAGAQELAARLVRAGVRAEAGGDLAQSVAATLAELPGGSALLVLGAGDIDTIREDLFRELALRRGSERAARA
ncbi:MAG: UDP-N-acetylmuramate--L-alanine ligase [Planctomycetes bacterium]|nr:UDP-N-acetylmuramate--L-alanine ligase [Planctomycetota bacterium]